MDDIKTAELVRRI